MDLDDEDFLGVLLDAASTTRLKLVAGDEARVVLMQLGALGEETRSLSMCGARAPPGIGTSWRASPSHRARRTHG
ncbi:hypothetical protein ACFWUZ_30445 [Streptomyces sp. NPDC058646]|uniref:hypothetical protein n=1 Tax=Streptomyces sp. NPDC058646 TaxID=3346574 RepID=UPI00364C57B3